MSDFIRRGCTMVNHPTDGPVVYHPPLIRADGSVLARGFTHCPACGTVLATDPPVAR